MAKACLLATILLPLPSSSLELSGTIVNSIGKPVSGVVVTLVGKGIHDTPLRYCGRMGPLYTWTEAMGVSASYDSTRLDAPVPTRGICPAGWHLPGDSDWVALRDLVTGTTQVPSIQLRARWGWYNGLGTDGEGTWGLCLQPSGTRDPDGTFHVSDLWGHWWSTSQINDSTAWGQRMAYTSSKLERYYAKKQMSLAVRCLKD